jgi:electron transport complex protein RnfG
MRNLYVRLAVPVVVVCAVASAGLSATYAVTKDRIAAQEIEAQNRALATVLPGAAEFKPMKDAATLAAAQKAAGDVTVKALFDAGETGWGVIVAPRGYGGPMTIVVGLDRSGKVTGLTVVGHNETPGLGTKAVGESSGPKPKIQTDLVGAASSEAARKVDVVMGATKSSRGVKKGAEAALLIYEGVLSKGGGSK